MRRRHKSSHRLLNKGLALVTMFALAGAQGFFEIGLASAAEFFVNANHCHWPRDGSPGNPFCTIQEGVDAAKTNDTVRVGEGTYKENVKLIGPDGITLKARSDSVIHCPVGLTGDGILITSNDNRIDGFEITGCDIGVRVSSGDRNLIGNNRLQNNILGILLIKGNQNNIYNNIYHNEVEGSICHGILLESGTHNIFEEKEVEPGRELCFIVGDNYQVLHDYDAKAEDDDFGGFILATTDNTRFDNKVHLNRPSGFSGVFGRG